MNRSNDSCSGSWRNPKYITRPNLQDLKLQIKTLGDPSEPIRTGPDIEMLMYRLPVMQLSPNYQLTKKE